MNVSVFTLSLKEVGEKKKALFYGILTLNELLELSSALQLFCVWMQNGIESEHLL